MASQLEFGSFCAESMGSSAISAAMVGEIAGASVSPSVSVALITTPLCSGMISRIRCTRKIRRVYSLHEQVVVLHMG